MNLEEQRLLVFFKNSNKSNFWKSVSEISEGLGVTEEDVINLVDNSNMFYIKEGSVVGKAMVTTKDNFRKYQSFGKRFLSAFTNRIA